MLSGSRTRRSASVVVRTAIGPLVDVRMLETPKCAGALVRVVPNFLIIGAPKAGTTSLYGYWEQHPQLYMSPRKEPRFFSFEGETLPNHPILRQAITDSESYRALFDGVSNESAIGEATPPYLSNPQAPERIRHHIPRLRTCLSALENHIYPKHS
jgi:hypothetical protein